MPTNATLSSAPFSRPPRRAAALVLLAATTVLAVATVPTRASAQQDCSCFGLVPTDGCRVNGEDTFYNGFKLSEFGDPYGLTKLGVEKVGVFFTRGVLLDVAGIRGADRLPIGHVITPAELAICEAQVNQAGANRTFSCFVP